jgi:hypothetical protein
MNGAASPSSINLSRIITKAKSLTSNLKQKVLCKSIEILTHKPMRLPMRALISAQEIQMNNSSCSNTLSIKKYLAQSKQDHSPPMLLVVFLVSFCFFVLTSGISDAVPYFLIEGSRLPSISHFHCQLLQLQDLNKRLHCEVHLPQKSNASLRSTQVADFAKRISLTTQIKELAL